MLLHYAITHMLACACLSRHLQMRETHTDQALMVKCFGQMTAIEAGCPALSNQSYQALSQYTSSLMQDLFSFLKVKKNMQDMMSLYDLMTIQNSKYIFNLTIFETLFKRLRLPLPYGNAYILVFLLLFFSNYFSYYYFQCTDIVSTHLGMMDQS